MGWIAQEYDETVHVVPDTDPDQEPHVLDAECWCVPRPEDVEGADGKARVLWTHRDALDRLELS